MNTQHLAKLRISPLHIQQGLSASLALMITLIVVQQFNHWNQNSESTPAPSYSHTAPFTEATSLKATEVALSFQPVEGVVAGVKEAPRRQSWVF
jgi:hypothetical protein